jgi:hypothetical protein
MLFVPAMAFAAEPHDDPKSLVEAIYDSYKPGAKREIPESYYSSRLLALMADQRQSAQAALFAPISDEAALAGEPEAVVLELDGVYPRSVAAITPPVKRARGVRRCSCLSGVRCGAMTAPLGRRSWDAWLATISRQNG